MRSHYMRLFYLFLFCLAAASLMAQQSQDNSPHIQPRGPEVAPKTKSSKPQPQEQPSPEASAAD